jgi:hypothetical protein
LSIDKKKNEENIFLILPAAPDLLLSGQWALLGSDILVLFFPFSSGKVGNAAAILDRSTWDFGREQEVA